MNSWDLYIYFLLPTIVALVFSFVFAAKKVVSMPKVLLFAGLAIVVFATFIVLLWSTLSRPPMRTMGETRLLYSLFLMIVGLLVWKKSGFRLVLGFSYLLAIIFMLINLFKPQIHVQELMPALQSIWFVPHVVVYMISYALIGSAFLIAVGVDKRAGNRLFYCDALINYGLALLTMGMVMGALWAKAAWGDYWAWDPKEVWAAITWAFGLIYIHFRKSSPKNEIIAYICVVVMFISFQICWYGINYLPTSVNSVHTYL